ncbi:unnamed protein product [Darwinula stevensoni]|uniref:lysozyme n=1 Tax=Darwinula stevensoni TaxID=69355 RepID=A0A7R8XCW2_9CRUS|nr:unnamed protein product [Darwinula stevensoni]CAG0887982.1 unnamed protein product [Darwinula stevensoni]
MRVCLAESESGRTTTKTNLNKNKSKDFGIFQINNKYWCSPPATGGCKIPCQSLLNDDISDDAKCAKTIYKSSGFKAWYGWRAKCQGKNTAVYLRGCNL